MRTFLAVMVLFLALTFVPPASQAASCAVRPVIVTLHAPARRRRRPVRYPEA